MKTISTALVLVLLLNLPATAATPAATIVSNMYVGSFIGNAVALTNLNLPVQTVSWDPNDATNNYNWGPWTPGTVTCGINEALAAANTSDASSPTNGQVGGVRLKFKPGIYQCSGSISLPHGYAQNYILEGDGPGFGGQATLNYHAFSDVAPLDFVTNTPAPDGSAPFNLVLSNLRFTYEPVSTNFILSLSDYNAVYAEQCVFAGWGLITNGGANGNAFSGYMSPHANAVCGAMLGTPTWQGAPFNLAWFKNCSFWNLNAGVFVNNDHAYFEHCSFSLMADYAAYTYTNSLWPVAPGGVFHLPESPLALKPGVIDNSTLGDIRMIDCSTYYGNTLFLRMHGRGTPIIQNSSIADIEFSQYFLLQYDDIPDAQVNIAGPLPVGATFQKARLVHKPGTILAEYPRNLQISTSDRWKGNTNLVHFEAAGVGSSAPTYAPVVSGAAPADLHLSKDGARNVINGNTYLDQIASGVSVDTSKLSVNGGSDPGINGSYYRSDRIYDATIEQGAYNIASYTNAAFALVLGDADYGMGFGNGGGFYALGDSNCLNTLYYRPFGAGADIAPGFTLPYHGTYVADTGTGTPPTVTASLVTNTTTILGPLTVSGTITGNGFGLTNLTLTISGTNAVPPKDTRRIRAWANVTLPDGQVMKMPLYQ